jgi:hypothetical protein
MPITLSRPPEDERRNPALIRRMNRANLLCGALRIHGELLKLGIEVSQATVGRHLPRRRKAPSPTWRSFLPNHLTAIAAADMFVVATATFKLLYAVIVLNHYRRQVIDFGVTQSPIKVWLAQQITEAFPWGAALRYLLRDRDTSHGVGFQNRARAELTRSMPKGSLAQSVVSVSTHVIIFNEMHLRRVLSCYFRYHHRSRTHLSLNKGRPDPRRIRPPSGGKIVEFPAVGGLHHRYERRAA